MADLSIIPNGAVLIRNGIVDEIGPARRVENLAGARDAREIDAAGRVVMPAFVDADMALVRPASTDNSPMDECRALRLMSRRKAEARAAALAAEWARYGCATVGAYTPCATDMKNIGKVLGVYRALKFRPLRIRPIFSPGAEDPDALTSRWLPSVLRNKQAAILELRVEEFPEPVLRHVANTAAELGYAIRLRSAASPDPAALQFALSAGAIAIVGPNDRQRAFISPLADAGCVRVIPAAEAFDNSANAAADMRKAIGEGAAIAIASSHRAREASSFNMQFLLHLAVDRLGLTPEEAIVATTWNAACALRLSHVTGSIEPGRSADLLLMEVPDYRDLAQRAGHHDASLVMLAGNAIFEASGKPPARRNAWD